ncbi:unnamed protein product [Prorocentrum cordatum]|uniref:Uncharacterized protein n=1 Tax=Prorocentrum cordatum TaxID=2364126 RepID=A0ABN9PBK6_9DINO|nr:unnamed protein product [Polarella glacialis]
MARPARGAAARACLGLAACLLSAGAANEAGAASKKASPTEKVVGLLDDLREKVLKEGTFEAGTYNDFSCFCKDTMTEKSEAITTGEDTKDALEADIQAAMIRRNDADKGLQKATGSISDLQAEIQTMTAEHHEEALRSEKDELDLTNAVHALEAAIRELQAAKVATSFISVAPLAKRIGHAVALAQVLGFPHVQGKPAAALLQALTDPLDIPDSVYEFHSADIITTLEGLMTDFKSKRVEVQEAAVEAKKVYLALLQEKEDALGVHESAISASKTTQATETKAISTASADLSAVSAKLLDDQNYLADLSAQCHEKAVIWNQRTDMRARELQAIVSATEMIKSLQEESAKGGAAELAQRGARAGARAAAPALVQVSAHGRRRRGAAEERPARDGLSGGGGAAERDPQLARALSLLRSKAGSLKSVALLNLTSTAAEDPLAKVKQLIQALVERLLKEAAAEANHKGWCDKEVGLAEQKRDYAAKELKEINSFLQSSEVRHEKLAEQAETLETEIEDLATEFNKAAAIRSFEAAEAKMAISSARNSSQVVATAMDMLDKFYREAANQGTSQLSLFQAQSLSRNGTAPGSTLKEDMPDAGFNDVYTGDQGSATGIMALLEVVKSDFDRAATETEKAEKEAEQESGLRCRPTWASRTPRRGRP